MKHEDDMYVKNTWETVRPKNISMNYEPFLKWLREHGITNYFLEYKCGIPQQTLHRLRYGETVSLSTLARLSYITGCPIEQMFEYEVV